MSIEIALSSLTESSYKKQYETCFNKWWRFCLKRNISPYKNSVQDILIFLTDLYKDGAVHSSINCYRSAISLLVGPEMAHDDRIRRFFKGLSKLRPSRPKYDLTWDPKIVLDYFSSLPRNDELSIKDLTMKLICLLALVTGHRMQTFSLIKVENIELTQDSIKIKIPDRIKTSGPDRKQPVLLLHFFKANEKICAATALQCYLDRTRNVREGIQSPFISHKRPFKAVTSQTLSRWVKVILDKSGIDSNMFTAHSIRHTSTSAARKKGIDMDTLRRTAGWTKSSNTFAKFYNLSLNMDADADAFAKVILIS